MDNRSKVQTIVTENASASIVKQMQAVTPQQLGAMQKRIRDAVELRKSKELEKADTLSKDFAELETKWTDSKSLAALFTSLKIDPKAYLMQAYMSDDELRAKGFDPVARTRNLKAYKKVREVAEYVMTGTSHLEPVMKTFVACSIVAAQNSKSERFPRNVCERFLNSVPVDDIASDVAEAISKYRAEHMTGGASTQTSQCTLTLANLKAGSVQRDGRSKLFGIDLESDLVKALAERFGMQV